MRVAALPAPYDRGPLSALIAAVLSIVTSTGPISHQ
jgi:hypothetical protein